MNAKPCKCCGTHDKGPGELCGKCWTWASGFLAERFAAQPTETVEVPILKAQS